jgi:hypothetical protein
MRRSVLMVAVLVAAAALAAGFASSAGAYGGGASHDTWQIGLSFNCNNPASSFCQNPETGLPELGGFWGWVEFDRFADGTITGDEQVTGCGHTLGGGGFAGAEHADVDITSAHLVAAGPDDPNFGTPGAQVFYIDSNVVNGEPTSARRAQRSPSWSSFRRRLSLKSWRSSDGTQRIRPLSRSSSSASCGVTLIGVTPTTTWRRPR